MGSTLSRHLSPEDERDKVRPATDPCKRDGTHQFPPLDASRFRSRRADSGMCDFQALKSAVFTSNCRYSHFMGYNSAGGELWLRVRSQGKSRFEGRHPRKGIVHTVLPRYSYSHYPHHGIPAHRTVCDTPLIRTVIIIFIDPSRGIQDKVENQIKNPMAADTATRMRNTLAQDLLVTTPVRSGSRGWTRVSM